MQPAIEEGSFWTVKQRQAHSLHEVPYRACFKPQLPLFFIESFSKPGQRIMDPFMGRGTTLLMAALTGRVPIGSDVNPLCSMLIRSRLFPPDFEAIEERLTSIPWKSTEPHGDDLLAFYHPQTLEQLLSLRRYLIERQQCNKFDKVDDWIRMVALTRLSGHSRYFFSVYTLPPNQATYPDRQRKINAKLNQKPEPRDILTIILRKSRQLLSDCLPEEISQLRKTACKAIITTSLASKLDHLPDQSIDLVITSPPFLTEVDYKLDNWLRCWFADIDVNSVQISQLGTVKSWQKMMQEVLEELHRVVKPSGRIVVEVGEVRKGSIMLEEPLREAAFQARLRLDKLLINRQSFTKTSNCWGIANNCRGTNTNRIAIFFRP